jgi:excisionase family DNA binding protein
MEEREVEETGEVERLAVRVETAAKMLDISKSKAHQLIREKKLPAVKIGDTLRVPVAGLRQLLGTA